jgi:hypothetical protein
MNSNWWIVNKRNVLKMRVVTHIKTQVNKKTFIKNQSKNCSYKYQGVPSLENYNE